MAKITKEQKELLDQMQRGDQSRVIEFLNTNHTHYKEVVTGKRKDDRVWNAIRYQIEQRNAPEEKAPSVNETLDFKHEIKRLKGVIEAKNIQLKELREQLQDQSEPTIEQIKENVGEKGIESLMGDWDKTTKKQLRKIIVTQSQEKARYETLAHERLKKLKELRQENNKIKLELKKGDNSGSMNIKNTTQDLRKEKKRLEDILNSREQQVNKLETTCIELESKLESLKNTNLHLQSELREYRTDLGTYTDKDADKARKLHQEIMDLKAENQDLNETNKQFAVQIQKLNGQIQELQGEKMKLKDQVDEQYKQLQEYYEGDSDDIVRFNERVLELESENKKLNRLIEQLGVGLSEELQLRYTRIIEQLSTKLVEAISFTQ